jgi:cyclopropane fatty-acyl-phospholipid synthase-like methyltransferase
VGRSSTAAGRDVELYYDNNQILYDLLWSRDGLHYGFWEEGTRSHQESILNPIRLIVQRLQIREDDRVLDAGCGSGGSSIYIARQQRARVEGIALNEKQLRIARRRAARANAADRVRFSKRDYLKTGFADGSFTNVFGLESICYATRKIDFLREAYRLLRPGGRVAVVDAFLATRHLTRRDMRHYRRFLAGWALPGLESRQAFHEQLAAVGFESVRFEDKTDAIRRSAERIYRLGQAAYCVTLSLSLLGLVHPSVHGHAVACVHQKGLVDRGLVVYGMFSARKNGRGVPRR